MIIKKCINNKPLEGNDIAPKLNVGEPYIIQEEYTCKCGQVHYSVGLTCNVNYVECYKCRETLPQSKLIHWCNSIRFE